MATEGLSNVRRHAQASRVTIRVACCDGNLSMRIDNDDASDTDYIGVDRAESLLSSPLVGLVGALDEPVSGAQGGQ